MVVPRAVQNADKDADEAMDAFEAAVKETEGSPSALDAIDGEEAAVDAVETPDVDEQDPSAEEISVKQPDEVSGEEETYKQKYATLQGKYNAEVPRLQSQLNELSARLTDMLTKRPEVIERAQQAEQDKKGPAHSRYLKDNEREDYGDEVLDMQGRMAKGVAESVTEAMTRPLLNRIEYLESLVMDTSSQNFWSRVESQIPDAQSTNDSDPLWAEFLGGTEPNSGLTYREIGERAYAANDVSRMVNLFKAFGSPAKAQTTVKNKPPVKPGKVASNVVSAGNTDKPRIKESDVQKFYAEVARGMYKGRPDALKAKEKAIDEAFSEGRIVAG
jgi:hypothetical protein